MSIDYIPAVDENIKYDYIKRSYYIGSDEDGKSYMALAVVVKEDSSFEMVPVKSSKGDRLRKKYVAACDVVEIEICDGEAVWMGAISYDEHNVSRKRAGGRDDTWDKYTFIFNVIDALQNSNSRPSITFKFKYEGDDIIFDIFDSDNGSIKKYLNNFKLEREEDEFVVEFLKTFKEIHIDLLCSTIRAGHFEKASGWILTDVDINSCDSTGWTALQYACYFGHLNIVQWLVDDLEAEINKCSDKNFAPAQCACKHDYLDIIQFLISRGASLDNGIISSDTVTSISVRNKAAETLQWVAGSDGPIAEEIKNNHGVRDRTPLIGMFQLLPERK